MVRDETSENFLACLEDHILLLLLQNDIRKLCINVTYFDTFHMLNRMTLLDPANVIFREDYKCIARFV